MENELIVELETHEFRPDIFLAEPSFPELDSQFEGLEWALSSECYIVWYFQGLN